MFQIQRKKLVNTLVNINIIRLSRIFYILRRDQQVYLLGVGHLLGTQAEMTMCIIEVKLKDLRNLTFS